MLQKKFFSWNFNFYAAIFTFLWWSSYLQNYITVRVVLYQSLLYINHSHSLRKIYGNTGFRWPLFSRITVIPYFPVIPHILCSDYSCSMYNYNEDDPTEPTRKSKCRLRVFNHYLMTWWFYFIVETFVKI